MKIEIGDKVSFKKMVEGNYTISENMSKILDSYCVVKNVSNEKILIHYQLDDIWIPKSFVEKIISKHLTNKEKKRIEELNSEFNSEFEKYKIFKLRNFLDKCGAGILSVVLFLFIILAICFDIWQLTLSFIGVIAIIMIGYALICQISNSKYTKLREKAKTLIAKEEYGRLKAYLNF